MQCAQVALKNLTRAGEVQRSKIVQKKKRRRLMMMIEWDCLSFECINEWRGLGVFCTWSSIVDTRRIIDAQLVILLNPFVIYERQFQCLFFLARFLLETSLRLLSLSELVIDLLFNAMCCKCNTMRVETSLLLHHKRRREKNRWLTTENKWKSYWSVKCDERWRDFFDVLIVIQHSILMRMKIKSIFLQISSFTWKVHESETWKYWDVIKILDKTLKCISYISYTSTLHDSWFVD
jgi:hypothetical protein